MSNAFTGILILDFKQTFLTLGTLCLLDDIHCDSTMRCSEF